VERPSSDAELAECVRTLQALVGVVDTVRHALDRLARQAPVREAAAAAAAKKRKARKSSRKGKRKAKA
jgi:hypothetical protein